MQSTIFVEFSSAFTEDFTKTPISTDYREKCNVINDVHVFGHDESSQHATETRIQLHLIKKNDRHKLSMS